jgi:hypothetical protein
MPGSLDSAGKRLLINRMTLSPSLRITALCFASLTLGAALLVGCSDENANDPPVVISTNSAAPDANSAAGTPGAAGTSGGVTGGGQAGGATLKEIPGR